MLNHPRVLVVAAHPDDEVLGCGATLARLADAGARVSILILGEGATSRQDERRPAEVADALEELSGSARRAAEVLGAREVWTEGLPDNRFDTVALLDVVKRVEAAKARANPTLVLTHHAGDLNVDHQVTQRAVLTAFRPLPGEEPADLYAFEVLSSTEFAGPAAGSAFLPDTYVDVEATLERKVEALRCYASEVRPDPHPRSPEAVRHLAAVRGRQVGRRAAEAFVCLRRVVP